MAKEAYYFSHDSNARHDPKILAMRSVYGIEGYGRYWILIELLREQTDYKLKKSKHLFNALAMQMQCDADAVHSFVQDCINEFELLQEDEDFIWCNSLFKRMEIKNTKSEKARRAAKKRWEKSSNDDGSMQSHDDENANAMQTHSERKALKEKKVKESKGKEKKENIIIKEKEDDAENAFSFFQENGFGTVGGFVSQNIDSWLHDFGNDHSILIEAMKIAIKNNKRKFSYAEGILRDWHNKGYRTLEDIKAGELSESNRSGPRNNSGKAQTTESGLPEWYREPKLAKNM